MGMSLNVKHKAATALLTAMVINPPNVKKSYTSHPCIQKTVIWNFNRYQDVLYKN
jgi:hypothetical protein